MGLFFINCFNWISISPVKTIIYIPLENEEISILIFVFSLQTFEEYTSSDNEVGFSNPENWNVSAGNVYSNVS